MFGFGIYSEGFKYLREHGDVQMDSVGEDGLFFDIFMLYLYN